MGSVELNPLCVGIDIGQIRDNTAICVSEVAQVDTGKIKYTSNPTRGGFNPGGGRWIPPTGAEPVLRTEYTVRFIKRLPLGTSYPDVAEYLADMLCKETFADRSVRVLLDSTGIGRAIYDDLRKEIRLRKETKHILLKPISFVHGENYNRTKGSLGKAFLVSRLQSLLQGNRVHAPDTKEMKATLDELRVYQIKVTNDGKDTYGASTGAHDDLATALALAVLEDPFGEHVSYSGRLY